MEGVEIVITPRTIERVIFAVVIIALLVLLIIKWGDGSCKVPEAEKNKTAPVQAAANQTNQTALGANTTANQLSALCSNSAKDQDETDVDCGGSCPGCIEFKNCNLDKDCGTGLYCYQHIKCMKPSCEDGLKNQDESNIDCGGSCGGFWWASDAKCHPVKEPSGKLDIKISVDKSSSTVGYALINRVTFTIDNGLTSTVFLKATIYALTESGKYVFTDQEGNNIPLIENLELDSLASGGKLTKVVDIANSTNREVLYGVESTDAYQLVVEMRNQENVLIEKKIWTNS